MFGQLLTTREVAQLLAMSEEWVRENAAELGGIRMGRTARSQLRFDPEGIAAYKERQRLGAPMEPKSRRRPGPRPAPRGVELFEPKRVERLPLPASARTRGSH